MRLIETIPHANRPLNECWPRWWRDVWYWTGRRSPVWASEALVGDYVANGERWDW